jgi:sulfhydrogenase subunit alpha
MSRTIVVEHLARIEGHAGITVEIDGDRLERVTFDVFEGIRLLEELVRGRHFTEVPAIVSRVCAICSHAHAITAIEALERALDVTVSGQTRLLRDLAYQGGSIESHALHVFCLVLPDLLGVPSVIELADTHRDAVSLALRLKKLGNTVQEVVGGRAVHPVNYVVGGFGRVPSSDELLRLRDALEAGLDDCDAALAVLREVQVPAFADTPLRCAALAPDDEAFFFGRSVRLTDGVEVPVEAYRSLTNEEPVPHSHAKHSLFGGQPYLVGALARLSLHGHRIGGRAREAWHALKLAVPGTNIVANSVAQFVELVYSVEHALDLVQRLLAQGLDPSASTTPRAGAGKGTAATEAPRGTLFHHYALDEEGRVTSADIITPTAQNFSHAEDQFRAAVRARGTATDEELRHRLEIVARAYDPCVSCSVHAIRAR